MAVMDRPCTGKNKGACSIKFNIRLNGWHIEIPTDIREYLNLKSNDQVSVYIQRDDEEEYQALLNHLIHEGVLICNEENEQI